MSQILFAIATIGLIGASALTARWSTMNSLTSGNTIFDAFEQIDETWLYSDRIGAPAATPIERARVAIAGPLGLSAEEVIYFVGLTDKDGRRLQSNCNYLVTGKPFASRWWSIALYDSDTQHYVPNELNRSSWNSASIPYSEAGDWTITVSPTPEEPAWLPSQKDGARAFELMLRIYNPDDTTRVRLPKIDLPTVRRLSC
ncbi:MAG: DUF1214 domain-containing protein [Pseudomonadota bacterium]